MSDLGTAPGAVMSWAAGISADGTIVGTSQSADRKNHATRWNPDGTITALPTLPGGDNSGAEAINSNGVAVGFANGAGIEPHAVQWGRDGQVVDLGVNPADGDAIANTISPSGWVAGNSHHRNDYHPLAVRWPAPASH